MKAVVVLVTVPDAGTGRRISRELVRKKLAACVSMTQAIESTYRWKGKIERSAERLLIIKTLSKLTGRLGKVVKAGHPYEVPEILALPITKGFRPYIQWLERSVR